LELATSADRQRNALLLSETLCWNKAQAPCALEAYKRTFNSATCFVQLRHALDIKVFDKENPGPNHMQRSVNQVEAPSRISVYFA
jgi:hypothetical protein